VLGLQLLSGGRGCPQDGVVRARSLPSPAVQSEGPQALDSEESQSAKAHKLRLTEQKASEK